MTKAKPLSPIKPTTDQAWVYDEKGQTIWLGDPSAGNKIADVRGMMDVYGTICDTQNWDRHHMAQYTAGEKLLKSLIHGITA